MLAIMIFILGAHVFGRAEKMVNRLFIGGDLIFQTLGLGKNNPSKFLCETLVPVIEGGHCCGISGDAM
jgi:hypothetical protein